MSSRNRKNTDQGRKNHSQAAKKRKGFHKRITERGNYVKNPSGPKPSESTAALQNENKTLLQEHLAIEQAVAEVSRLLVAAGEAELQTILKKLGRAVSASRAYIFRFREGTRKMDNTHEWCDPETTPQIHLLQDLDSSIFPWWMEKLGNDEDIVIRDVDTLPEKAAEERKILKAQDIRSLLVVPIRSTQGILTGFMGFDDTRESRHWSQQTARALRVIAEMLAISWEHKRTRDAYDDLEKNYARILNNAPVWFWSANAEATQIYLASPGAKLLTGYEPEEFIKNPPLWFDLVLEEDRGIVLEANQSARKEKTPKSFECRVKHKDGSIRWMYDMVIPECNQEGQLTGVHGFAIDITGRKRAEEQMQFQAQLLDNVRESIVATDLDGRIVFWGKGAETLYGYSAGEVLGKPVTLIVEPESEKEEEQRMRQVFETGSWSGQYEQRRKDGSHFWADTVISLVKNEKGLPCGMIGIDRDITERKQYEQSLRQSETRYRTGFRAAPIAMATVDEKGMFLTTNRAFQLMLGYTEDELQRMTFMDLTHPKDLAESKKLFAHLLRGKYNRFQIEKRYISKDGSVVWACTAVSAVRDGQGRLQYAIAQIENITERKQAQEALDRSNKELAHTLEHLKQLSHHVLRVQEDLYKSIARELHDNLGQMVNAVKFRLERLGRNAAYLESGDLIPHRQEIEESVSQLIQISRDIRTLSRQMRPEVLDELGLVDALEAYIREFQGRTEIRSKFIPKISSRPLSPELQTHLYRIVQEALNNVATHSGAKSAVIRLEETTDGLFLSIEDDGRGFPLNKMGEERHHFQGVGLISMRERANLLKGKAEIQSRPGKGTKVSITVPLDENNAPFASPSDSERA